jgi:hypothetical protein
MRRLLQLMLIAALTVAVTPAGTFLYSQLPDQSGGSDLNGFLEADDFVLSGSVNLTSITFWSLQNDASDYTGNIFWSINSDASGVPGLTAAAGFDSPTPVSTGISAFGLNEFSYTWSVSVPLGPGTYWLMLHNGFPNVNPGTTMFWEWHADTGNSQSMDVAIDTAPWITNSSELAFRLDGDVTSTVPEPGSMLLLGLGLAGVFAARVRVCEKTGV